MVINGQCPLCEWAAKQSTGHQDAELVNRRNSGYLLTLDDERISMKDVAAALGQPATWLHHRLRAAGVLFWLR